VGRGFFILPVERKNEDDNESSAAA